jgi:hypothetical protein
MAAIKEFNELKQRVKKKLELTGSVSLAALFDKSKEQSDEE